MSVKRETVAERKALPLASGVLDYFPDALLVVAEVSRVGNEQHHPGQPLHWDKSKSSDEADALMRHLLDRGKLDTDGLRHSGKVAWRALALLQRELDAEAAGPDLSLSVSAEVEDIHREFLGTFRPDPIYRAGHEWAMGSVESRGEWPADTRVDGRLTCCGATEHTLECPQWR